MTGMRRNPKEVMHSPEMRPDGGAFGCSWQTTARRTKEREKRTGRNACSPQARWCAWFPKRRSEKAVTAIEHSRAPRGRSGRRSRRLGVPRRSSGRRGSRQRRGGRWTRPGKLGLTGSMPAMRTRSQMRSGRRWRDQSCGYTYQETAAADEGNPRRGRGQGLGP